MEKNKRDHPEKVIGYKQLINEFGADQIADRLLAKWITDPEANAKWERLSADVVVRYEDEYVQSLRRRERARRPFKYWIVLWYISMGYSEKDAADQLELSVHTIKRNVTYARINLDLIGAPIAQVVAKAIRLGFIP